VLIIVALIIIVMRSHHFNDCAGRLVEEQLAWLIVFRSKSNMLFNVPAMVSNEPPG
jgi:hypothetical protein